MGRREELKMGGMKKVLEVMNMFIILNLVMASHVELIKLYTLNACSLLYVISTSIKLFS